ncbi:MAG: hypothetical protein ACYSW8_18690 [Planctomycetota bacterium]|jgi:hypothetical protein
MPEEKTPDESSAGGFSGSGEELLGFELADSEETEPSTEETEQAGDDEATATPGETPEATEGSEETQEEAEPASPDSEAESETEEETPPEPEPFEFAGKEYESREKAEQFYKSYLGQVGSLEKKNQELVEKLIESNERLTRVLQEKPAEGPAEPNEEAESAKPLSLWDTLNRDHFKEKMEEGDTEGALDYLCYKIDGVLDARENNLKQTELSSWSDFRSQMAEVKEAQGIFEKFSDRKDDSGNPLYPEFQEETPENRAFLDMVVQRWKEMPGRKEMVKSGNGEYSAYLAYLDVKEWQRYHKKPEPAPETVPKVSEPEKPQRTPAPGVSTGSGMPRPAGTGRAADQAKILQEIDAFMKEDDPTLGL